MSLEYQNKPGPRCGQRSEFQWDLGCGPGAVVAIRRCELLARPQAIFVFTRVMWPPCWTSTNSINTSSLASLSNLLISVPLQQHMPRGRLRTGTGGGICYLSQSYHFQRHVLPMCTFVSSASTTTRCCRSEVEEQLKLALLVSPMSPSHHHC